ncbi:hypothetical protein FB45DRAFT_1039739 [Roridomyces roridus]|uniref:Uncharacterized protein n=1 Tax=Roridomyces roridus TaxID=1738132 RepID=A0AAD7B260_9AGAR|nr:hypothetical protein FB45DRAFT_1039739 [Roridomyces roridus]
MSPIRPSRCQQMVCVFTTSTSSASHGDSLTTYEPCLVPKARPTISGLAESHSDAQHAETELSGAKTSMSSRRRRSESSGSSGPSLRTDVPLHTTWELDRVGRDVALHGLDDDTSSNPKLELVARTTLGVSALLNLANAMTLDTHRIAELRQLLRLRLRVSPSPMTTANRLPAASWPRPTPTLSCTTECWE